MQPAPATNHLPAFSWGPFLLVLSIMATWQITYAPYVADYSRYLPTNTPTQKTFWYTYLGSVIGASWMMILGSIATVISPKQSEDMVSYFGKLSGSGISYITLILIVCGVLAINALNLYGGFMSVVTTVSAFANWKVTSRTRLTFILIVSIIGTTVSIWGQGNFIDNYSKFLLLLLYFMVPWTAINLVDFYFLRKGNYNIRDIFDANGEYGKVNWIAIFTYVLGVAVQFPFMNTELYVGSIAKYMNGADIAWIIGIIVSAALYYYPMRGKVKRIITSDTSTTV